MTSRPSDETILGLYVWADGSTSGGAATNDSIDIIAVQGLGASPYYTWVKSVSDGKGGSGVKDVMWLRDLLPHHIRNARIATFSYISDWFTYGKGVKTSIRELGEQLLNVLWQNRQNADRRPIIFVGHSMGGLVIKQALVLSSNRPKFEDIKYSTVGIIFLGTPHAGSLIADYGAFIAKVKRNDPALVESLNPTDKGLHDLSMDFAAGYKNLNVMCFYEKVQKDYAKGLGGIMGRVAKLMIVEPQSAVLEGRDVMHLLTDHSGLNKFIGEEDPNFRLVCAVLESMARDAHQVVQQQQQYHKATQSRIKPIFTVPFPRDDKFTGRESFLAQIDERLQAQHCVSLHGIGGIGKSQIVTEYAYQFHQRYQHCHVFWISGVSLVRFRQTYRDIARQLRLPGVDDQDKNPCELLAWWFNNGNDDDDGDDNSDPQWLMILDSADNTNLFFPLAGDDPTSDVALGGEKPLINYLPTRLSSRRHMIVTSRSGHLGENLTQGNLSIVIPPFSPVESRTLFQLRARAITEQGDQSSMWQLLDVLGHIPLAITQAAAFMNRNRMSLVKYLAMLEKHNQNLTDHLSRDFQDPRREHDMPNSVFRTWKLSFDQIRGQEPRTADLLSLMAILDRQNIPEFLLRPKDHEVDFIHAIGTLEGLSLITREVGNETFAMHRLVQLSIRYWLGLDKRETFYQEKALRLLAERFPAGEHENRKVCESLLSHAQIVLQYDLRSESIIVPLAALLHNVGWLDWRQGKYNAASSKVIRACQLRQEVLGEASREIESLGLQAIILGFQGKYKQAEEMHRQTLRFYETVLGKEHPDTLASMNNLATVLSEQGKYKEAEEIHRQILRLRETALGKEHPYVLSSMHNLASVLSHQGKYQQAEEMYRKALKLKETVLGKEHPNTLASMNNLATVLSGQGKYKEAEEIHRQTLRLRETALGKEHPDTLSSMCNLANVLSHQGKYEQAEEMQRQTLELYEMALGKEHPDTLSSMHSLANVLIHQGKYEQAEETHRQTLELYEMALGKDHPDTLTSMSNLASVFSYQGKYYEAERLHQQILRLRETALGKEHPDTLVSMAHLASIYWSQTRWTEAEALEIQVVQITKRVLGPKHPQTLANMVNLAYTWKSLGRYDEAITLLREAVTLRSEVLGNEHPSAMSSTQTLERWLASKPG